MGQRQVASDDDIANRVELLLQGFALCRNCNGLRHLYGSVPCRMCDSTGRFFKCLRCKDTGYDPDEHTDTAFGLEPIGCLACRDRDDEDYRLKHRLP